MATMRKRTPSTTGGTGTPYLSARQNGGSPQEASIAADRYMDEVLHVPPR
jgi:hypothetical protein